MSYRFDTPLVSNAYHFGNRGLGVLGSEIASSGTNGAGYIFDDLTLPADANKEYSGFVETPPGVGTFFAFEDSSFIYEGPSTTFTYRLREDGVDLGTQTVTLTAIEGYAATMTWTEDADTHSITASSLGVSLGWIEESDGHTVAASLLVGSTAAWTEADDTHSITGSVIAAGATAGSLGWTEDSDTASLNAGISIPVTMSWVEADDVYNLSVNTVTPSSANVYWLEADDSCSVALNVLQSTVGTLNWLEDNDSSNIAVQIPVSFTMSWTEANDVCLVTASLPSALPPLPHRIQVKFRNPKYKITFRRI